MEQAFIRNKWFVLACVAVAAMVGMFMYSATDYSRRATSCVQYADSILHDHDQYQFIDSDGWENDTARRDSARASYLSCLMTNGIDIRSVPSFDEIFADERISYEGEIDPFELLGEDMEDEDVGYDDTGDTGDAGDAEVQVE
jgi:hypothetical protein